MNKPKTKEDEKLARDFNLFMISLLLCFIVYFPLPLFWLLLTPLKLCGWLGL